MGILDWLLIAMGILIGLSAGVMIRRRRSSRPDLIDLIFPYRPAPPGGGGTPGDMTGKPVRPTRTPSSLRGAAEAIPEVDTSEIAIKGQTLTTRSVRSDA